MTKGKSLIGYMPYISNQRYGFVAPIFRLGASLFTETEGLFPGSPNLIVSVYQDEFLSFDATWCEISDRDFNYGVLLNSEELAVGPKAYIKKIVYQHGEHLFADSAINLQISEIFGSLVEKRNSRNIFISEVSKVISEENASRFRNDAIPRSSLWEHISQNMVFDENIEYLSSLRRHAIRNADFDLKTLFSEQIWEKLAPHLAIDKDKFISDFHAEIRGDLLADADHRTYRDYYN